MQGRRLIEIDCSCSIDSRDESTWSEGGDCEYGSVIAHEAGWEMDTSLDGTCCIIYDFWVPSIRYNDVALCIIGLDPRC